MRTRPTLIFIAGAILIGAHLVYFAGPEVWNYFVPDDMMNIHGWWVEPVWKLVQANLLFFSPSYRPMGGVFYTTIYGLFGFNPLPFHIAQFALLLFNLYLLYAVASRLAGSREAGALAALIGSYHPWFFALYGSTGTVYDVLAFTFYFAAFLCYLRVRQDGRVPGWRQLVLFGLLYVAALNSKEIACTLGAMVGVYELIYHPPKSLRLRELGAWLARNGRGPIVGAALTIPYIIGKTMLPGPLKGHPAYTPEFTLDRFLTMSVLNLEQYLETRVDIVPASLIAVWAALLLVALVTRNRTLRFAWVYIMVSPLPIVFLYHHRGGFNLYIPIFGWLLFAAVLLVKLRDLLAAGIRRLFRRGAPTAGSEWRLRWDQLALFLLAGAALLPSRFVRCPDHEWLKVDQERIRTIVEPMKARYPALPRGAKLLFLEDPEPLDYNLYFTVRLCYRDENLGITRVKRMEKPPASAADYAAYDYAIRLGKTEAVQVWKALPTTAQVLNVTRPGATDFRVGETFRVVVTGPPGRLVRNNASFNGSPFARADYGLTGADGRFSLTGKMGKEHAGVWEQDWSVGESVAPRVKFEVKPQTTPETPPRAPG